MPHSKEDSYSTSSHRSEEVQDIVDRMPTGWSRLVTIIVICLIGILTVVSFVVSYPDTVDGEITLTAEVAPTRLVASTSGRLHLLRQPGDTLREKDVIGYIESGVDYSAILYLDSLLHLGLQDYLPSFDTQIELGELSNSYGAYIQAYTHWYRMKSSTRHSTIREAMRRQRATDQQLLGFIDEGLGLQQKIVETSQDLLNRDSILMSKQYVAEYEYKQNANSLLSLRNSLVGAQSSRLSKQSEVQQTNIQILRSEIEEEEAIAEALNALEVRYQSLANDVRLWKERYLFVSRGIGILDYLGFWRENMMIQAGSEIFSIIPYSQIAIGEAIIPALGAGKVKVGMDVNIKLNDYPYDEYGLLRGKVVSISILTHQVSSPNGNINAYRVRIALPDGLQTNFGHTLSPNLETKGVAEIITKPRRLIERLFDNLKSRANK